MLPINLVLSCIFKLILLKKSVYCFALNPFFPRPSVSLDKLPKVSLKLRFISVSNCLVKVELRFKPFVAVCKSLTNFVVFPINETSICICACIFLLFILVPPYFYANKKTILFSIVFFLAFSLILLNQSF